MALQLFDVAGGYSLENTARILTGTGLPGSGTNDGGYAQAADAGSVYLRTGTGELYLKVTGGATTADWVKQATLQDIDDALSVLEFQDSALDYITDNTLAPASENLGDRYILSHDGGVPHPDYDGASAGDIVEFDGTSWIATTPTTGTFISADDEDALLYYWGGSSYTQKAFENTTASTGLVKVGDDIQLADATSNAISVTSGVIDVVADGIDDTMIDFGLGAGQVNAADLPYNNATSGLTATDTQAAIDEVEGRVDVLEQNAPVQTDSLANTGGAAITADSVLVDEVVAVTWHILIEDTTTGDREYHQVSATHDGSADGVTDATDTVYNEISRLRLTNVAGDDITVDLDGTGATQAMRLRVSANNTFDVRVLRAESIKF